MDIVTAVLQARVNTILVFAGIIIVFLTLFNLSLSKKTIELRPVIRSNRNTIITAIILGAGLILIGLFFKPEVSSPAQPTLASSLTISSQTPSPVPIKPSQTPTTTATATATATLTPILATTEPSPTPTPQPPAIGEDWKEGCVSKLWIPYPSRSTIPSVNGCHAGQVGLFKVANGGLAFGYRDTPSIAEIHGFFARLPSGELTRLNVDASLSHLINGEIWIGIFSEPNFTSKGLLLVIPPGEVTNRLIIVKTMPDERRIDGTTLIQSDKALYSMEFNISRQVVNSRSINANLDFNHFEMDSPDKWVFLGFRALNGEFSHIEGEFLNLVVKSQ